MLLSYAQGDLFPQLESIFSSRSHGIKKLKNVLNSAHLLFLHEQLNFLKPLTHSYLSFKIFLVINDLDKASLMSEVSSCHISSNANRKQSQALPQNL